MKEPLPRPARRWAGGAVALGSIPVSTAIHWFRRDLRLHDHQALALAAEGGRSVVCAFVLDPRILERQDTGAARVRYLLAALAELDRALRQRGSALVVRHGDAVTEIPRLAAEVEAGVVTAVRDAEPFARDRDRRVHDALRRHGRPGLRLTDEQTWAVLRDTLSGAGTPYTVFSPFRRRWQTLLAAEGPGAPAATPWTALTPLHRLPRSQPLPTAPSLGFRSDQEIPEPGERAARQRLDRFVEAADGLARYDRLRDRPDLAATSRLSADLRFGALSIRSCLRAALELGGATTSPAVRAAVDTWLGELAWRDFYASVLWHFPDVEQQAFRAERRSLRWDDDPERLAAWQLGRTGVPIVDAAMRQLAGEAFMHNRCRMIVASFLTKDLHCDWRLGERWFMRHLVDGDLAANNGGWQWAASTGTDAQPWFRIFNPVLQGRRFDPAGEYVRRWVPELRRVPAAHIHAPWELGPAERAACGLGRGEYPDPIVDHARERRAALERYGAANHRRA